MLTQCSMEVTLLTVVLIHHSRWHSYWLRHTGTEHGSQEVCGQCQDPTLHLTHLQGGCFYTESYPRVLQGTALSKSFPAVARNQALPDLGEPEGATVKRDGRRHGIIIYGIIWKNQPSS